jgi:hypothetical protein
MSDTDLHYTFVTATQYGGNFFRRLAEAGLAADPLNRQRLLTAFPELATIYGPDTELHKFLRVAA